MRWLTYATGRGEVPRPGVVADGLVHGRGGPESLLELLTAGVDLAAEGREVLRAPSEVHDEGAVVVHAPIPTPLSIRDFMAFEEHVVTSIARHRSHDRPRLVRRAGLLLHQPRGRLRADRPGAELAPGSDEFDYELEIAVVIGKEGSDIPVGQARDHIAGYTILVRLERAGPPGARDVRGARAGEGQGLGDDARALARDPR